MQLIDTITTRQLASALTYVLHTTYKYQVRNWCAKWKKEHTAWTVSASFAVNANFHIHCVWRTFIRAKIVVLCSRENTRPCSWLCIVSLLAFLFRVQEVIIWLPLVCSCIAAITDEAQTRPTIKTNNNLSLMFSPRRPLNWKRNSA